MSFLRREYLLISLLFVGWIACQPVKTEDLRGQWQAVELTEEGDSLAVNLEEITLAFSDLGYTFSSTLNYQEAGTYQLDQNLLTTTDSLNGTAGEKTVEIARLQNDSLFIRMNEAGKERRLVMIRK